MGRDSKILKVELQSLGVKIEAVEKGRKGGAGPAAGRTLIFGGLKANVPTLSRFVESSPYSITPADDRYILKKDGKPIMEVSFPAPKFYGFKTKDGIPYWKIALLHGDDCLATTVVQRCVYWNTRARCKFCGIELSLQHGMTIERKTAAQILEVALAAKDDGVKHVTLTIGTVPGPDKGIRALAEVGKVLREEAGLPVHVQFEPPRRLELLDELYGCADTVGAHIESFDATTLREIAPCKAAIGFERYRETWRRCVSLFGENQVSSFLIVGVGESDASVIKGSEELATLGVYPFVVPLRPIPGTLLEDAIPPPPSRMLRIYEAIADILKDYGLSWRRCKAGCVRCGACSAIGDFERA